MVNPIDTWVLLFKSLNTPFSYYNPTRAARFRILMNHHFCMRTFCGLSCVGIILILPLLPNTFQ